MAATETLKSRESRAWVDQLMQSAMFLQEPSSGSLGDFFLDADVALTAAGMCREGASRPQTGSCQPEGLPEPFWLDVEFHV